MLSIPVIGLASLALIALLSFLTLCECSIASCRRSRLKEWASQGDRGAELALGLSEQPEGFLAIIRLGTISLAMAIGLSCGGPLAGSVSRSLSGFSVSESVGEPLSYGLVLSGLALTMYICGDVLPRQIALSRPEWVAVRVARPMRALSVLAMPVERFWGTTFQVLLRNIGIHLADEPAVTEEEIKVMLEEGTKAGVFEAAEQQLVERVFRYCDRRAKAIMTPRDQIAWIDVNGSSEEIRRKVVDSPHSRFPVCDESLDNLIGVVEAKNLLTSNVSGEPWKVKGALNIPLFLYEGTRGLRILEMFRKSTTRVAIVLDEYGSVVGILTPNDILQAIVGELSDREADEFSKSGHGGTRTRVLDGRLPLDEFSEMFNLPEFPREDYDTLAGFVVTRFGRIPKAGECFSWNSLKFEVVRMVGNRVDRVAVIANPVVNR